ncbi:multiple epidermal growth factor-like domains protein 10, partial [Dreissena polymorpha]|uniref:multiple epidermal growth factor-like domains protein 10 n=1 Tax=Dreissena polymorpha TaxID=45954 RepID=UPI0022645A90
FGLNCSSECHCLHGANCNHVSGNCSDELCAPGWTNSNCSVACNPGTFGANCSYICHCYNTEICHHIDGTCPVNQCAAGWTHDNCSVACDKGLFGLNCSSECHCLHGTNCNHVSGKCSGEKCEPGWTYSNCSVACTPGFYGQRCSMDCHCDKCHSVNGSCVGSLQCHDGFRMENGFCTPFSPECHTDKNYNALLAVSSVLGVVVAAVIVLSVLIIRWKHCQFVGEIRANRESSCHKMYDDLAPNSTNRNFYDYLQMS